MTEAAQLETNETSVQGKLVLIDGYGIIFRAYHAIKSGLATSKGELTNATFGFTSMLLEVLRRDTPDYIVMAFDAGRTFRHDEFSAYKANRSEMPADLRGQLGRIREMVEAMGIIIYEQEGFEADDVIGTLAVQANQRGLEALIVTGDNDLLQLVNEHTRAVLPGAGPKARFQDARYFDTAGVIERYGFGPEFVPDYKAIVGDKSDNIPNVPGVGDKTATTLINQYGHIENILDHLDEIKPPKAQESIRAFRAQVIQSKRIATIVTDVPLKLDIESAKAGQVNRARVIEIFRELEFNSLVGKLNNVALISGPSASEGSPPPTPGLDTKTSKPKARKNGQLSMFGETEAEAAPLPKVTSEPFKPEVARSLPEGVEYQAVRTPDALRKLAARLMKAERFAFDTETDGLDANRAELVGLSLSPAPNEAYYIPLRHTGATGAELMPDQLSWDEVREVLGPAFFDPKIKKVAHNAKFDLMILHRAGWDLRKVTVEFDVMLAAQLIGLLKAGLKDLAFNRLGHEMTHIEELIGTGKRQTTFDLVPIEIAAPYACADADMTLRLVDDLRPQLARDGLLHLFEEVEMPLVPVLATMELCGVAVDVPSLQTISTALYEKMQILEKDIYAAATYPFNINSTEQLGQVLFGKLGLKGGRKTAKGKYSTDKETLEALRGADPVVEQIVEYRQLGKLKSTYVDTLPLLINPGTGRIHTSFNQMGASSGRLSSSDPNLQNIPIRTDAGSEVRRAFVADNASPHHLFKEQSVLFAADYSQIELRLLAHFTDDERLVDAFQNNRDIHAATAADVFGVTPESVTPEMRRMAKTVNFGIIYGLSAHGLAARTSFSYKEASDFIKSYNERYPRIKAFLDQTPDKARKIGYVETLFGRRRYMPDLSSPNANIRQAAERAAINMPVQGTAADIVKKAMITIDAGMRQAGLQAKLLLQVHDELVFEVPQSEVEELARLVKGRMESAASLSVPLKADLKVGQNWRDMNSYKIGAGIAESLSA